MCLFHVCQEHAVRNTGAGCHALLQIFPTQELNLITCVSCVSWTAGRFLTAEPREALVYIQTFFVQKAQQSQNGSPEFGQSYSHLFKSWLMAPGGSHHQAVSRGKLPRAPHCPAERKPWDNYPSLSPPALWASPRASHWLNTMGSQRTRGPSKCNP